MDRVAPKLVAAGERPAHALPVSLHLLHLAIRQVDVDQFRRHLEPLPGHVAVADGVDRFEFLVWGKELYRIALQSNPFGLYPRLAPQDAETIGPREQCAVRLGGQVAPVDDRIPVEARLVLSGEDGQIRFDRERLRRLGVRWMERNGRPSGRGRDGVNAGDGSEKLHARAYEGRAVR